MAHPLRRETVDRLLREVVSRARAINARNEYAYRVAKLMLCSAAPWPRRNGRMMSDLAVTLVPRYRDREQQQRAERVRVRGWPPLRAVAELFWPERFYAL
jgi:hypothetical protein